MKRSDTCLLTVLLSLSWQGAAYAQAAACVVPDRLERPKAPDQRQQSTVNVATTGYLLALSWSPEFCRGRKDQRRHAMQCSGEAGQFGFILHGLWPNAPGYRDPRWCRAVPTPDTATLRTQLCRTPSVDLLAHEWAKHGSCGFVDADRYFKAGAIMYDAVRFPDMKRLSRQNPDAGTIRRAFAAINKGLPAGAVAVVTNRRQWLEEIRLCLGRDFRPLNCASEDKGAADDQPVKIWRGG